LGNLSNLTKLVLGGNQLSGNIPLGIGSLIKLEWLVLNSNKLSGEIPVQLMNLNKLSLFAISYNCLYTSSPTLRAWLDFKEPGWDNFQNQCNR